MSYRSNCLSAFLVLLFLTAADPVDALEYYIDANLHYIDKESVYIEKAEFPGFYKFHAVEESSSVKSFFDGLIFGFINGFVLSGEDIVVSEEQTDFVLALSSVQPVFEIFSDNFAEMSSLGKTDLHEKFIANSECFSFGMADHNGKLHRFDMYVMDGSYSSYFRCLKKHITAFKELSSNQ
ncbi:hypothetical protein [Thalassospira sp.]|uniref:hypothetical protein n=1 Tax=Thalassospira sp. TaxID=1912094 RepID=UPI0032EB380E